MWNICIMKSQLMGWPVNYDDRGYDATKVNFISATTYLKAVEMVGQKVTLKLIKNGKLTDKDTSISISGTSTWFPGDLNAVTQKGGLVNVASTKDFGSQMAASVLMISKWASDNKEQVSNLIAAACLGGDQVKSHVEALEFAAEVGKDVFASTMSKEDIVKAYSSYDITDDDGNVVNIGGSHVFNLSDAANYTGINGSQDKYKSVYNTFGNIDVEAYPEIIPSFVPYEEAVDWSYLKVAYNKYKSKAGNVSKVDFKEATKSDELVGDAAYSIEFNSGSAVIKTASYPTLDKILARLNIADNLFVGIEGHTDNTGSDDINIPLSKQRANAVREYLLSKDNQLSDRIPLADVKGYGSTRPLPDADNNTAEGKAKNRRVEIKLSRAN